jgi:hypothetical protein
MKTIIFYWMMLTGSVKPQEPVDGRKSYSLELKDSTVVEHAYKGEILNYLKTGTFVYNEDIKD